MFKDDDHSGERMNEDFNQIIKKADLQKRQKTEQKKEDIEKPPREAFRKPYSFFIFRSFKLSHIGFWWLALGISVPIPILLDKYNSKTTRYIAFALLAIAFLRIIFHYVKMYFMYLEYRKILRNLPFRIEGWEELASSANFIKYRFWRHGEIQFHFSKNNNVPEKVIKSLLYLFISEANSNFYFTDDNPVPQEWKIFPDGRLMGDINCHVAGALYQFIKKELIPLHRKYICIDKIEIRFEKRYFRTDPIEASSGEGTAL